MNMNAMNTPNTTDTTDVKPANNGRISERVGYTASPRPTFERASAILFNSVTRHLWGDAGSGPVADWIYASTDKVHCIVFGLPPRGWLPAIPDFRSLVAAALVIQHYDGVQPWGFKEPKMCLMWRLWDQHFPGARWVIVRRPIEQVVDSCMRTSFLRYQSSNPAVLAEVR
ncbi:MAG: hypothetical protein HC853_16515 [Anaerolineae bacterium]|nr:hypothetical protein [Anaerolineae bacterium]